MGAEEYKLIFAGVLLAAVGCHYGARAIYRRHRRPLDRTFRATWHAAIRTTTNTARLLLNAIGRAVSAIQAGMLHQARLTGNWARKAMIWSLVLFVFSYWTEPFDFDPLHEIFLGFNKVGELAADFVAKRSPRHTLEPLFPEGTSEGKPFFVGFARLLFLGFLLLMIFAAALLMVIFLVNTIRRTFGATRRGHFASGREIAATRKLGGAAFGHYRGAPLMLNTDKHVLVMASTRSGKGTTLIIPHLLRYAGSAFVLDPKGENARATHRQRRKLNGKVLFLDPFGISGQPQARFNPLSRFTLENMEAESKALAAALVLTRGDHWTGSAQQLLASFIMFVFASDKFVPDDKDLRTVRRLLLSDVAGTLANMEQSKIAGGLLADLARSFQKTPSNEFGSIVSTAQRETEILDNPFIADCLSASGEGEEVDFAAWHNGTMTVYLCLAAPKFPVFNRWLRLVLTAALDEMTDRLNPPALPVCFMLDELATLGHLAVVENAIGLSAGYGVQIFAVFQDTAQMRDLYKGRWASFIGNAGIRALFNLDDYETAEYWSKFIGSHEVESRNQQYDAFGLIQSKRCEDPTGLAYLF